MRTYTITLYLKTDMKREIIFIDAEDATDAMKIAEINHGKTFICSEIRAGMVPSEVAALYKTEAKGEHITDGPNSAIDIHDSMKPIFIKSDNPVTPQPSTK